MADLIVVAVVLVIVGAAIAYIVKEKRRGVRCVGCPSGGICSRKREGTVGCGCGRHSDGK